MKKEEESNPLERLSPREYQVLELVVNGKTSKEIASLAGLKPSTIFTYRSRIMGKLGIDDIPSLVRLAIRHRMIKP
jgi:two-component system invasion response regulator UvrY